MTPDTPNDAEYWKARYLAERERLVKLWVAYRTLEEGLEAGAEGDDAPPARAP